MKFFSSFAANQRRALAFLLIGMTALALFYSLLVPLFEGPDEDDHFRYAKYLADHRALPVQLFQPGGGEAGHQGWQPPFYYALVALVIAPIDTSDFAEHLWRNPAQSFQGDPACCGRNSYFHAASEDFPYTRTTLAVHLARGVSILFGVVTIGAIFFLAQEFFHSIGFAFVAAALVAFNPSFLFASALVSNDVPLAGFCSLALYVCTRILNRTWELNMRTSVRLGVLAALGVLTKTTALGLIPFVLAAQAYGVWREAGAPCAVNQTRARKFFANASVFILVILALTGWYFVRNQILYGDPFALRLINASAIFPRETPPTIYEWLYISLPWLWQTFWGGPVPGDFSPVFLAGLTVLSILAFIGLGIFVARIVQRKSLVTDPVSERRLPYSILILLAGWLAFILFSQIQFIRLSGGTDQGRYLFPAIGSFAILFVLGLAELFNAIGNSLRLSAPPPLHALAPLLPGSFLLLSLYVPFAYVIPAYARPPRRTETVLGSAEKTLDANFANEIALRGYALSSRDVRRGGTWQVTLYWNALAPMKESYRVFVHLVDGQGHVAGGKDVIPVRGAYATVLWSPGEWIEDSVTLEIVRDAIPGAYQVEIGLYPFGKPDERLNLANSDQDHVLVDAIQVKP